MNPSEIEALFARTLLGDYEDDDAWAAIFSLQSHGSREIFELAAAWCFAEDALKRARGTDILCQLRRAPVSGEENPYEPEWMFRDESCLLIAKLLESEQDPMVLNSAISALGHLGYAEGIPAVLRYQDHPVRNIRFAVAFALGSFPNDPRSVDALIKLTSDPDDRVRDWAVFGLGVLGNADSLEIREALLRSLEDANEDAREEAALGLGKRRDERLIPKLLTMLEEPEVGSRVAEAADALLGFDRDPPEWGAEDYRAAIRSKFQISD